MKSKLAVFDFDLTIRDPDPGNDWSYGVSHLFPGKEILESFFFACTKAACTLGLSLHKAK